MKGVGIWHRAETTGKGFTGVAGDPQRLRWRQENMGGVPNKFKWEKGVGRQQVIKLASS